jgi:hypothetical protein
MVLDSRSGIASEVIQVCRRHGCLYFPAARVRMAAINCVVV